jgi:hypothetical protein
MKHKKEAVQLFISGFVGAITSIWIESLKNSYPAYNICSLALWVVMVVLAIFGILGIVVYLLNI